MALVGKDFEGVVLFRDGISRVIGAIRSSKAFVADRRYRKPEWDDLKRLIEAFEDRHTDEDRERRPDAYAIGESMDQAAEPFDGTQRPTTKFFLKQCFDGLLEGRAFWEYAKYQSDMLLFLGRLRKDLNNRINRARLQNRSKR